MKSNNSTLALESKTSLILKPIIFVIGLMSFLTLLTLI